MAKIKDAFSMPILGIVFAVIIAILSLQTMGVIDVLEVATGVQVTVLFLALLALVYETAKNGIEPTLSDILGIAGIIFVALVIITKLMKWYIVGWNYLEIAIYWGFVIIILHRMVYKNIKGR